MVKGGNKIGAATRAFTSSRVRQNPPEAKDGATPIKTWTSNALLRVCQTGDLR
jgi:hypothetical protein